uniref:Putative O-antigen ligase n=1 Tax=viral metagenome TaxID=1070528 RepID=A0A6M3KJ76_9ZZZZ
MLTVASYIVLAFLTIFILGSRSCETYEAPRFTLVSFAAIILGLLWSIYDATLFYDPFFVGLIITLIWWWVVCTLNSERTDLVIKYLLVFTSIVTICMMLKVEYLKFGMICMVIGGVLNCIYAIMESQFKYEPLSTNSNKITLQPIGFQGNVTFLGNFLLPNFFVSLWLAHTCSNWWFIATVIIGYTIVLSKARSAYFGLLIGISYVLLFLLGFKVGVVVVSIVVSSGAVTFFVLRRYQHIPSIWILVRDGSLKERMKYFRVGIEQIKKTPSLGLGFDRFMAQVPIIQKELNNKTNGKFMSNYSNPYPRRVHNDFLQHALDNGIFGLVIILAIIAYALYNAPMCGVAYWYLLVAGLLSILASGIFSFNFYIQPTNAWFWLFIFTLSKSTTMFMTLNQLALVMFFGTGAVLFYRHIFMKTFLFDIYMQEFFIKNQQAPPLKALLIHPLDGTANTHASNFYFTKKNIPLLFFHTICALEHYDGKTKYWNVWTNLGTVFMLVGSPQMAKICYKQALTYGMLEKETEHGLAQAEQLIKQMDAFEKHMKGEQNGSTQRSNET